MSEKYQAALKEAKKLSERSDEALYQELGLRIEDIKNLGGYERSQQYTAEYAQVADDMLSIGDLRKIGQRWWNRIEKSMMEIICDENNLEVQEITSGKTIPQIAASLATATIISSFAPPAWVIVAATIIATKVVEAGLDSLCEVWQESLRDTS